MYTSFFFFFFNDTATTEIYTLSLHDALPICVALDASGNLYIADPNNNRIRKVAAAPPSPKLLPPPATVVMIDRKSTRLNSSHVSISYAVFCLKKKNQR